MKPSTLKRRAELLRSTSFFRDASVRLLRELAEGCYDREIKEGEVLCRAGEVGDSLYIVDSGTLEIYLDDAPLDTAGRGACLGEMSLVTDQTRSASIRALDPVRILQLDRKIFSKVLQSNSELAWGIFRELSGKLRSSIDVRVKQHRTNQMLTEAFERSVSRSVMDEILRRRNPAKLLEGSTMDATVLFADVRSFTSLSETMKPNGVIELLNEYLSAMVDIILDAGGTLDKFMGDGILAHFGVPLPGKDDVVSALRCAVLMQHRLRELNKHGAKLPDNPLKIGIGLATGSVVAGCIGSARRMEYTVIGNIVNLASRIEGLTKLYGLEILCCAETAKKTRGSITLRKIDTVCVKGKSLSTELWTPAKAATSSGTAAAFDKNYHEALRLYEAGDFTATAKAFAALHRKHPDEGPVKTFADRTRLLAGEPPRSWDGVFILDSK